MYDSSFGGKSMKKIFLLIATIILLAILSFSSIYSTCAQSRYSFQKNTKMTGIAIGSQYINDSTMLELISFIDAMRSSVKSLGDGFFIWDYNNLINNKYDIKKIINSYHSIQE